MSYYYKGFTFAFNPEKSNEFKIIADTSIPILENLLEIFPQRDLVNLGVLSWADMSNFKKGKDSRYKNLITDLREWKRMRISNENLLEEIQIFHRVSMVTKNFNQMMKKLTEVRKLLVDVYDMNYRLVWYNEVQYWR